MANLGNLLMGLAFVSTFISVAALIWGDRMGGEQGESVTNLGYLASFAALMALSTSVAILLAGFFRGDFTMMYVAENHSTDVSSLAWLYTISALWAGREGSLLFWAWLLSCFIAWVAYRRMPITDRLSNMGLMVANVVQLFFLFSLFVNTNNPFKISPAEWLGPNGELLTTTAMNPLLQHWAMILHPPTLFIGYAGLTIPFAFAVAAIIVNDGSKRWVEIVDRITVFSWLFLGAGIGLGSVWAYVVLGWGGYWAWDPVENASLLPWLTGVGLLHSFTVYKRRDGFKKWSIALASVTFALVILGTFITRSGVVESVHAFQKDMFSLSIFLTMIIGSVVVGVGGMMWRGATFEGNDEFESLTSKEAAYYFNNVIMLVAGLLVAYLTVTSALPKWLPGGGQSFTAATYDAVARPVGILYVLIMAVCPLLVWRKTDAKVFLERAKLPMAVAAVLSALLMVEWWTILFPIFKKSKMASSQFMTIVHNGEAIVGLIVGAFAISTALFLFIEGARKRAAAKGESISTALFNIIFKARSQSGGYITHMGIGIILIGLVGSAMFVDDSKLMIDAKEGSSFKSAPYTFVYKGVSEQTLKNGDVVANAVFEVQKGGKVVRTMTPGQVQFARQDQTKLNAAVISEPLKDYFLVFEGFDGDKIALNLKVNPLIWFSWGGFLITLLGTTLAVWPKRSAAR